VKVNDEVEGQKVFGPTSLVLCEDLGCGEALNVSMVGNDIDWCTGTFEVMSPSLKSFIDSTQLLVIVAFGCFEHSGVKSDQVQLARGGRNG